MKKDLSNDYPGQDRVYGSAFIPEINRILVSTGFTRGVVWASDDGGYTWTLKKDFSDEDPTNPPVLNTVLSLAYDSYNQKLIAGTADEGQIWVSDDYGDNWTLKKNLSQESPAQDLIFSITIATD